MLLGICLATVLVLMFTIWVLIKDRHFVFLALALSVFLGVPIFGIVNSIELDAPPYSQFPYEAVAGDSYMLSPRVYFRDYSIGSIDTLIIPSHYYLKRDWVNRWVYCDESMSIVYPDSIAQGHVYRRQIPSPYVKEGSVECK